MEQQITEEKKILTPFLDNELINLIKASDKKNIIVLGFENNYTENALYEEVAKLKNVKKVLLFGTSQKKGLNKKVKCASRMNKRFLKDSDATVFYTKTDLDDDIIVPLIRLRDLCCKMEIEFGIGEIIGCTTQYDEQFETALKAILAENRYRRNEIIYDYLCEELDERFKENKLCKFCNNRCVLNRKKYDRGKIMGCCESFDIKFNFIVNVRLCKYLGEKGCTVKNLGCKLFTCNYLRKQGYRFKLEKMLLARCFFTRRQREILRTSFFITKEEVLKKI